MTWQTYYERFYDWAESTQIKNMSSLTDFGPSAEVCEIAEELYEQQPATRLIRKALKAGVKFTAEEVATLAEIVDEGLVKDLRKSMTTSMGWKTFYEHFDAWPESVQNDFALRQQEFGPSAEVTEVAESIWDEAISSAFVRNATKGGIQFSADEVDNLSGSVDEETATQVLYREDPDMSWEDFYNAFHGWQDTVQHRQALVQKDFGPSEEIHEVVFAMIDENIASKFLEHAVAAGVRFAAEEVVDLENYVHDDDVMKKMIKTATTKFTMDELEELSQYLDESELLDVAEENDIIIDELTMEFEGDWMTPPPPPQPKGPGFFGLMLMTLTAFGGHGKKKGHSGHCDGDCANCPPHYGYRYGRWYYGHHHVWGCQFGGNYGGGGMD